MIWQPYGEASGLICGCPTPTAFDQYVYIFDRLFGDDVKHLSMNDPRFLSLNGKGHDEQEQAEQVCRVDAYLVAMDKHSDQSKKLPTKLIEKHTKFKFRFSSVLILNETSMELF
jgi:hypothetical protein